MSDLRQIIGKNMVILRVNAHLTQAEFAEKFNYSDKAVSKWERGESMPDIEIIKSVADYYGVTVDWLLEAEHPVEKTPPTERERTRVKRNHLIITLMSVVLVWFIAVFVYSLSASVWKAYFLWEPYIVAVPVSLIVILVFNSVWGKKRWNYLIISLLIWCGLGMIYILLRQFRPWTIFLLGIPGQICVILWSRLRYHK